MVKYQCPVCILFYFNNSSIRRRFAAKPSNISLPITIVGVTNRPMSSFSSFMYFSLVVTSRSSYSIPF